MATETRRDPGTAILCLTRAGSQLAQKLSPSMGSCPVYLPRRLAGDEPDAKGLIYFDDWQTTFAKAFKQYDQLVCIMAAGIVVRSLAKCMVSKYQDPGVVVVDEKGQFAISLLAGHIGGANRLAAEVARLTGGQAVITTATDVQGKTAADLLALEMDALIDPPRHLKLINRCLAEDETVYIYSAWPLVPNVTQGFTRQAWPLDGHEIAGPAVIIGHSRSCDAWPEVLWLKPRNLSVGIGCRRGVEVQEIKSALEKVLGQHDLDGRCVRNLASIDLKADEAGLTQLAEEMEIPVLFFSREEIATLAGTYPESAWVQEITGVGGVCEPAARLASRQGITLVPKQNIGPVTISVAMEKSWWWDWAPETSNT
ncbi:MAG: cobalt-precorrin 5A hydrolase [Syntrophomonadaceae bacterium]